MAKLGIQYSSHQCSHYLQVSLLLRYNFKFSKPSRHTFSKPTLLTQANQLGVASFRLWPALCSSALGARKLHLPTGTKRLSTSKVIFLFCVWLLLCPLHTNLATLICPSLTSNEGTYNVLMMTSAQAVNMLLCWKSSKSKRVSAIWTFGRFLLLKVSH